MRPFSAHRVRPAHLIIAVSTIAALAGCSSSAKDADTTSAPPITTAATDASTTEPATTEPVVTEPETTAAPATTEDLSVPGDLPDGVYTADVTDTDLAALNIKPEEYAENHGTFTFTFAGGVWSEVQTTDNPIQYPTAQGTYIVEGDHVTFLVDNGPGPQEFDWVANADGILTFTSVASTNKYFAAYFSSHPLVPVAP